MVHRHRKYQMFPFTFLNKSRWGLLSREIRDLALGAIGTGLGCWAGYKALQYLAKVIWHKARSEDVVPSPNIPANASISAQAAYAVTAFTQNDLTDIDHQRGYADDFILRWMWRKFDSPLLRGSIAGFSSYYLFYRLYWWWDSVRAGRVQDKMIYRGMFGLSQSVKQARVLYEQLKDHAAWRDLPDCKPLFTFFESTVTENKQVKELFALLQSTAFDEVYGHRFDPGVLLRAYLVFDECCKEFMELMAAVGRVDAYCGLVTLSKEVAQTDNKLCFVEYSDGAPQLDFRQMWNPFLSAEHAVANDVMMGYPFDDEHFIITGANAGGKSTLLKGVALSVLMAQTCGMAPAASCMMSPFAVLETYLNITDDLQEGNSLFKKELMRAGELVRRAGDKRVLLIFDEMFNGTTPYEGVSCAYSVMDHLVVKPNVISLVATHFDYLTGLANEHANVANMRVALQPLRNGRWLRTYRLERGISDQHIALDMMAEEGIEPSIVAKAQEVLLDVKRSMLSSSPNS